MTSQRFLEAAMPGVFVILWSTGFIGMKYAAPYVEPLTFLAWRFALVAAIMTGVALLTKAPWPRRAADWGKVAIAGFLLQAVYLAGVYESLIHGLSAGTSSLIASLQPVLVTALAGPLLNERPGLRQWLGVALGLVGVGMVVGSLHLGGGAGPVAFAVTGLLGITAGTLWQKRYCPALDLRSGSAIQFAAAAFACALGALLVEDGRIVWNGQVVFAMAWLVLVLSVGAISLLFLLIRRGEVARVSALFFLVPPCTALIAWLVFDERLGWQDLAGMAVTGAGVALVSSAPPAARRAAARRAG